MFYSGQLRLRFKRIQFSQKSFRIPRGVVAYNVFRITIVDGDDVVSEFGARLCVDELYFL